MVYLRFVLFFLILQAAVLIFAPFWHKHTQVSGRFKLYLGKITKWLRLFPFPLSLVPGFDSPCWVWNRIKVAVRSEGGRVPAVMELQHRGQLRWRAGALGNKGKKMLFYRQISAEIGKTGCFQHVIRKLTCYDKCSSQVTTGSSWFPPKFSTFLLENRWDVWFFFPQQNCSKYLQRHLGSFFSRHLWNFILLLINSLLSLAHNRKVRHFHRPTASGENRQSSERGDHSFCRLLAPLWGWNEEMSIREAEKASGAT